MSTAVEQAGRQHIYQVTGTVEQILADLVQLQELDKRQEKLQFRWAMAALAGGLLGVAGFIFGIVSEFANPTMVWAAVGAGVLLLVVGLTMRLLHARGNYEDKRYLLLREVLKLLGADMATDASLQVRLDLRKPDVGDKYVGKGTAGLWNVKYYEDPWLQLQGRLLDGTSYYVAATELFQRRSRWKTNARGKSKHKSKTKSATEAVVRLRVKPARYEHLATLSADTQQAVQLPSWVGLKSIEVSGRDLVLKVKAKAPWDVPQGGRQPRCNGVQMVAMMFLSLYQVLNLSRRISKTQREGPAA